MSHAMCHVCCVTYLMDKVVVLVCGGSVPIWATQSGFKRIFPFQDSFCSVATSVNFKKLPRYQVTKLPSFKVTKLQSYRGKKLQSYQLTKLPSYQDNKLQSYQVTKIPGYPVTKLASYQNIPDCLTFQHRNSTSFFVFFYIWGGSSGSSQKSGKCGLGVLGHSAGLDEARTFRESWALYLS